MGLNKNFNQRGLNQGGPIVQKKKEKSSKCKLSNKNSTNVSSCYGCGMPRHLLTDYLLIPKMREKWRVKKNDNKRAMIAAWNDSEMSDSESEEEHTANMCLLAKELQDNERFEFESC